MADTSVRPFRSLHEDARGAAIALAKEYKYPTGAKASIDQPRWPTAGDLQSRDEFHADASSQLDVAHASSYELLLLYNIEASQGVANMSRFLLLVFVAALIAAMVLAIKGHEDDAIVSAVASFVAIALWLTFLPTFIAYRREHLNRVPILLLNLFLGWTVLGWIGALIWACLALPEPAPVRGFADPV